MTLNASMIVPVLFVIGLLTIPVLVATLDKDARRRRDARRVLVELVRLLRGR